MNDTPDCLMADTTVNASVGYSTKYTTNKFSLRVSVINIILYRETITAYP